jgi:hypothetical protein
VGAGVVLNYDAQEHWEAFVAPAHAEPNVRKVFENGESLDFGT